MIVREKTSARMPRVLRVKSVEEIVAAVLVGWDGMGKKGGHMF